MQDSCNFFLARSCKMVLPRKEKGLATHKKFLPDADVTVSLNLCACNLKVFGEENGSLASQTRKMAGGEG